MNFWVIASLGIIMGIILFLISYAIYASCGWQPAKWYIILMIAVPCLPYMTGNADVTNDGMMGMLAAHGAFTCSALCAYTAYTMYLQGHSVDYDEYYERTIEAKFGTPTDETLLDVKLKTYPSYATKKVEDNIERLYLLDVWKKMKKREIMKEDPLRWVFETMKKNKNQQ